MGATTAHGVGILTESDAICNATFVPYTAKFIIKLNLTPNIVWNLKAVNVGKFLRKYIWI